MSGVVDTNVEQFAEFKAEERTRIATVRGYNMQSATTERANWATRICIVGT